MVNDTIKKFRYPHSLLHEYQHWVVLLRLGQVTAGCMILACKESAQSLCQVSPQAYAELPTVTAGLEGTLKKTFEFDKINYLALMMVDKEVHFHVIPRYAGPRECAGVTFVDKRWPGPPDITEVTEMTDEQFEELKQRLVSAW